MFPFLFKHGDVLIPTFFTMMMVGVLAATFYLYFLAPRRGFSQVAVLDIGMIGAICGLLGGRLFHVFFEAWWFYQEDITRIFEFWRGGFVSFGAYIGGTLGVLAYLKYRKLPILKYGDFVALGLPLLVVFIRVGCLGAGCCYGKPTDFFIHLVFPHDLGSAGPPKGIPLHATQIYDLLNGVFLFVFLNWLYLKKKFDGQIMLLFFMLYSFIRGLIEFLRGDEDRGVYFDKMISTGQITGVLIIVICLGIYFYLWKRAKGTEKASVVPSSVQVS